MDTLKNLREQLEFHESLLQGAKDGKADKATINWLALKVAYDKQGIELALAQDIISGYKAQGFKELCDSTEKQERRFSPSMYFLKIIDLLEEIRSKLK